MNPALSDELDGLPRVRHLLAAWAHRRRINDAPNGYPDKTPFAHLIRIPGRGTVRMPYYTDDVLNTVDSAVSRLRVLFADHYESIDLYYCESLRDHQIAERMHKGREYVRGLRREGEMWVAGILDHSALIGGIAY